MGKRRITQPIGPAPTRSSTPSFRFFGATEGGQGAATGATGGSPPPPPSTARSAAVEERLRVIRSGARSSLSSAAEGRPPRQAPADSPTSACEDGQAPPSSAGA